MGLLRDEFCMSQLGMSVPVRVHGLVRVDVPLVAEVQIKLKSDGDCLEGKLTKEMGNGDL